MEIVAELHSEVIIDLYETPHIATRNSRNSDTRNIVSHLVFTIHA